MTTSSKTSFPTRFTRIDELTRPDHYHLGPDDECYFLGEYTARAGWSHSATNQLIFNLKKPLSRRGHSDWRYKGIAIAQAGEALRAGFQPDVLSEYRPTLIPIPPSKSRADPLYDDRMLQVLSEMCNGMQCDIRELVLQQSSTVAAHETDSRPGPADLVANYVIDAALASPEPELIFVFDDVLTTGAHFLAVKQVLVGRFPGTQVIGFFVARRVPQTVDVEAFFPSDGS